VTNIFLRVYKNINFQKISFMNVKKLITCLPAFLCTIIMVSCNQQKDKEPVSVPDAGHRVWSAQSNVYEVNLRQFTKEGTIMAFEKSLPRLKEMGVEILWFMPVTPIGLEGRKMTEKDMGSYYAVKDYKAFNPDYGTMDDWKKFVKHAQEMGFKVITDWVANHSAPDNDWIKTHPQFYAKDSSGKFIAPYDWTDVRKLNYDNPELRDSMISAMKFWLTETGIDGFRCDIAEEVPVDFWKTCIAELKKTKDVFMLAEGEKPELHEAGFDATYTWSIMHLMKDLYKGDKTLKQFDSANNANMARFPGNAYRLFFTSNHDENSWNGTEFEKYGEAGKAFAVFTQTMYQSIPLIYNGQEDMNRKRLKFFVKDTIPWEGEMDLAVFYKTLLDLRKTNAALAADGSFKKLATTADSSIYAYKREKEGQQVVVILNLSKQPQKFNFKDGAVAGEPLNVFTGTKEKISAAQQFSVDQWGYMVYSYR
jgi:glycosidase